MYSLVYCSWGGFCVEVIRTKVLPFLNIILKTLDNFIVGGGKMMLENSEIKRKYERNKEAIKWQRLLM